MIDDIKYHELWQYGYQKKRIDESKCLEIFRIISQEQLIRKNPKN